MSRCVACNSVLSYSDIKNVYEDGSEGDLCEVCRPITDNPDSVDDKYFQCENSEEGVSFIKRLDYF